jgi:hypothetical protein
LGGITVGFGEMWERKLQRGMREEEIGSSMLKIEPKKIPKFTNALARAP